MIITITIMTTTIMIMIIIIMILMIIIIIVIIIQTAQQGASISRSALKVHLTYTIYYILCTTCNIPYATYCMLYTLCTILCNMLYVCLREVVGVGVIPNADFVRGAEKARDGSQYCYCCCYYYYY